ncbi:ATP-dependent RNA helicase dbp6 [Mortierella sp. NVP41]|nr:ATP-dependent RNA helicase dbp6 [Mortierella sp. NVP41]
MFNIKRFDIEADTVNESIPTNTATTTSSNDRLAKLNARLNKNRPSTATTEPKADHSIPHKHSNDNTKQHNKKDRDNNNKTNEISYKRSREEEDARVAREEARRNKEQQQGKQRWEKRAKELKDSDLIPNDVRLAMKAEVEAKAKAEKEAKKNPFAAVATVVAAPQDLDIDMNGDGDEDHEEDEADGAEGDDAKDDQEERPELQLDGVERFADEAAADAALAELAALVPLPTFETKEISATEKERAKSMGIPDWLAHPTLIEPETNTPIAAPMFGFSNRLIKQCKKAGIEECFAVQTAVIPVLMRARHLGDIRKAPGDLCVSAPTGSGKTLAYVLPIIEILSQRVVTRLRALVVLPTRDLCIQVKETFETFVKGTDLKIATSTGQNSFAHEQAILVGESHSQPTSPHVLGGHSRVDVLITTPGRLIDHIKSTPNFTLQHLRFLVIDEADRLLNQSFQDWLFHILNAIHPSPEKKFLGVDGSETIQVKRDLLGFPIHDAIAPGFLPSFFQLPESDVEDPKALSVQKLLFSATLTRNPAKIASLQLSDPQYVAVQEGGQDGDEKQKYSTPAGLTEHMIVCETSEKPLMVLHLLHHLQVRSALCFTKSVESAHRLYKLIQLYEKIRTNTPTPTPAAAEKKEAKKSSKEQEQDEDRSESEGDEDSSSESDSEDDSSSSGSGSEDDEEEDDDNEDVEMEQVEASTKSTTTTSDMDIHSTTPTTTTPTSAAIVVAEYSSDLPKSKRQSILRAFNAGEIHLLICSDLISRGMDLSPVSVVINYDSPVYMKKYIHRVGRTARAGKTGTAYSLVEMQEARHFKEMISKAGHWDKIGRINVKNAEVKDLVPGNDNTMAALIRNGNNVRVSLIADAFSRLRLQHTGSSIALQHSTHFRHFTLTRPVLLKHTAGVDTTTTIDRDLTPSKLISHGTTPHQETQLPTPQQAIGPAKKYRTQKERGPRNARWTEEEERELYRLVKEGKVVDDIYENHFQHRSHAAVSARVRFALQAAHLQVQQASRGVREGEEDISKTAAGDEGATPFRGVYRKFINADIKRRNTSKSDDNNIQRIVLLRKELFRKDPWRKGRWTPEEDTLLEQLVHKFADIPQPSLWHRVSGGKVGDSTLFRSIKSCLRRWRQLFPPPSARTGPWTKEEERLLQKSISEQLEGKYQVAIDVLTGEYATKGMSPGEWRPNLQQLPSQSNLPMLKDGSARLRMLNWVAIGEKVESRTEEECHDHFYEVYHNGRRGPWSQEEKDRFRRSFDQLGEDHWKIAEHVGTRSPRQVYLLIRSLAKKKNKSEVEETAKETSFVKKK